MNTTTHYIDKTILKQVRNFLDIMINNYDKIIFKQDDKKFVERASIEGITYQVGQHSFQEEKEEIPQNWPGNDYY